MILAVWKPSFNLSLGTQLANIQYLCYPRLSIPAARSQWEQIRTLRMDEISAQIEANHYNSLEYYSVAKARANGEVLRELRSSTVELARQFGFPQIVSSHKKVEFDRQLAVLLHANMRLMPNDAAANEIWTFINLLVLPDVLLWRHGAWRNDLGCWSVSADRLYDITRTTFGRLWWRVEMLGNENVACLGEDECVQLMERPRIVGYGPLVRSIVLHHRSRSESSQRMELLREVTKMLTRRLAVLSVLAMREHQIDAFVLGIFIECEEAILNLD